MIETVPLAMQLPVTLALIKVGLGAAVIGCQMPVYDVIAQQWHTFRWFGIGEQAIPSLVHTLQWEATQVSIALTETLQGNPARATARLGLVVSDALVYICRIVEHQLLGSYDYYQTLLESSVV